MDYIKKLIGIVAGLFCTLVVAWLCAFQLKIDFIWYNLLVKPVFVPNPTIMTLLVSCVYFMSIVVIARLVTGKHFYPSMVLIAVLGIFSILFVHSFFTFKNVYLAFVFTIVIFAVSLILQVRFFTKELRISLYFLPIFIFNTYSVVAMSAIAFTN